jgi:hypothetical protein
VRIRNINGTSDKICVCDSWLDHWKNFSGQSLSNYCSESACTQKPEVGAHIQKDSFADQNWYIVPLCKAHNSASNKALAIGDGIKLVSANVSETCSRFSRYI